MPKEKRKKPNIIFILIDDLGWRDLSCYGSEFYETPNIDQLCQDGLHFTNAYAACPVCSPTRASILTGKYPANVGVTDWIGAHTQGRLIDAPYIDHLPAHEISLAKALQINGYRTWHVGKWHLGGTPSLPENHGFDVNIGGCHWGHPLNGYFSPWGIESLPDGSEGEYLTDRLTTEAIHLIEANDDTPFYLNMWYYSVHTPIEAKIETIEKYRQKAKTLGLDKVSPFVEGERFPCLHKRDQHVTRRIMQSDPVYAAMIEHLDENIGRLIKAVQNKGLAENTLIVFTSDNGGLSTAEGSPTCNFPLSEGKGWMYEGGTREPLIIKWPTVVQPGTVCHVPVTSPDFYPTLLEATQSDLMPEQHQDGCSLLPLLQGQKEIDRDAIYWHYPHYGNQGGTPGCSIRSGRYKLIEFFEDRRLELYDLETDIGEAHNLSERYPELTKALQAKLVTWRNQVRALVPQPNPEMSFVTSREIAAPPEAVFAAFADSDRLAAWWGPAGFTNTFHHCDFRPGGSWSFVMHGPDGKDYANESVFQAIEETSCVVIEHQSLPQYRLTITLKPIGDSATLVRWEQTFAKPEVARGIEHIVVPANEQNLDRLTAEVLRCVNDGN